MENKLVIQEGSVICDTDIWVMVCLAEIQAIFLKYHPSLFFSDVVEGEIMKWKSNGKYSKIATYFVEFKKRSRIKVIEHEIHIPKEDQIILENQLFQLGFENDFKNRPSEDDKGEFVSAIYADYFDIPILKTNDNAFAKDSRGEIAFPSLEIHNWQILTDYLIPDFKEKIRIRRMVELEAIKMKESNLQYKKNKIAEVTEENIDDKIAELLKMHSKH